MDGAEQIAVKPANLVKDTPADPSPADPSGEMGRSRDAAANQSSSDDDDSSSVASDDSVCLLHVSVLTSGEVEGIPFEGLRISDSEPCFVYKDSYRTWEAPVGPNEIWLTRVGLTSSDDIVEQLEYLDLDLPEGTRANHQSDTSLTSLFPDYTHLDVVITAEAIDIDLVLGETDERKMLVLRPCKSGHDMVSAGVGILASFAWTCSRASLGFQGGTQVALSVESVQQVHTTHSGTKRGLDDATSVGVGLTFGESVTRNDLGESKYVDKYAVVLRSTADRRPIAVEASLQRTLSLPTNADTWLLFEMSLSLRDLVDAGVFQLAFPLLRARSLVQPREARKEPLSFILETTLVIGMGSQVLHRLVPGVPSNALLFNHDISSHLALRIEEPSVRVHEEDEEEYDPQLYNGDYGGKMVQFVFNAGELPLTDNALACVPLVLRPGADYSIWQVFPSSRAAEYQTVGMVLGVFKVAVQGNANLDKWGACIIAEQVQ